MQFAAAALTAIGTAISSTVTGVTTTAGAAASTAGAAASTAGAAGGLGSLFSGGSLLSTILQGGATVASVMGSMRAGNEQARSFDLAAKDANTDQKIEALRGEERRDGLRRQLLETLGQRDVAAAASGVDLSFGTPALAREEAAIDGEKALGLDAATQDLRVTRLQEREAELRRSAAATRRAGRTRALGAALGFGAQVARRGVIEV